jgi:hypothetical protein
MHAPARDRLPPTVASFSVGKVEHCNCKHIVKISYCCRGFRCAHKLCDSHRLLRLCGCQAPPVFKPAARWQRTCSDSFCPRTKIVPLLSLRCSPTETGCLQRRHTNPMIHRLRHCRLEATRSQAVYHCIFRFCRHLICRGRCNCVRLCEDIVLVIRRSFPRKALYFLFVAGSLASSSSGSCPNCASPLYLLASHLLKEYLNFYCLQNRYIYS